MAEYKAVSMNLLHFNIGINDGIYAVLSGEDIKETIGRLGQHVSDAGNVSHDAIDQLATMLLQRMSDLKGGSASV